MLEFLRAAIPLVTPASCRRKSGRNAAGKMPALRELSVAIVNDDTIAEINERFLAHTGPTDVISFDLGDGLGELIVSAERAVAMAKKLRRPPRGELALYLVHGLLHLAGMDDHTAVGRRAMRTAERRILRQLPPCR